MKIEFDPHKSAKNESERGLPFDLVQELDWQTAVVRPDTRHPYPEPRFSALVYLHQRLHVLVFTPVADGIRVISFRKANSREIKAHAQFTATH